MSKNSVDKPNILFFFSDQQRWDTLGCYGQEMNTTPNLDRMAAEGVRFEHAFSPQPACGPARACLQTGKYASELGCFRNEIELPQNEKTIANWISEAGYEVGYIGKWHLACTTSNEEFLLPPVPREPRTPLQKEPVPPEKRGGYDYWLASDAIEWTSHSYDGHVFDANMQQVEFKGYRADCVTDFALDYLRSRDGQKPFFLFLSQLEPHQEVDTNIYECPLGLEKRFENYPVPGDLADTDAYWQENYARYLAACNNLDTNIGRVMDELEKLGLAENTLIIYTSDHSCHFQTRNHKDKFSCHEASIRIPMIIYGPGFKGGKVISKLVSLLDLPPTLLSVAGLNKSDEMGGRPLQDLVDGTGADWPEEVLIQIGDTQVGRAIRTNKWKYSVSAPDKDGRVVGVSDSYVEEFLYDLETDPHELNNLVRDPALAEVRRELAATLKRRMVEAGEKEPAIEPLLQ